MSDLRSNANVMQRGVNETKIILESISCFENSYKINVNLCLFILVKIPSNAIKF